VASIIKRGPHQFQVQIRRKGYPAKQLTFESRREAEGWAATVESEMHRSVWVDRSEVMAGRFGRRSSLQDHFPIGQSVQNGQARFRAQ